MNMGSNAVVTGANQVDDPTGAPATFRGPRLDRRLLSPNGGIPIP